MNVLASFQRWVDGPRFCDGCGRAVTVEDQPTFDVGTGEARSRWVTYCPQLSVYLAPRGYTVYGGLSEHLLQYGRPGWHKREVVADREAT